MLLYDSDVSGNCYKVRLLLTQLGLEYERYPMDVVDRSNRQEVLGDLNPGLRVPTLVLDDERPLGESGAILWYLGDGTEYVPSDPYDRAKVLQWMFFEQYSHEPYVAVARFWLTKGIEVDPETLAERQRVGYLALDAMEGHLAGHEFLAGGAYTIADIAIFPWVRNLIGFYGAAELVGIDAYPNVTRALAAFVARPAVQAGLVKRVVMRFGERKTLYVGLLAGMAGFLVYGLAPNGIVFLLGVPVFAFIGLVQPALQSLMTRRVGPSEQGRLQGVNASIMGLTGILGPLLFDSVFASFVGARPIVDLPGAPYILAAVVMLASAALAIRVTRASRRASISVTRSCVIGRGGWTWYTGSAGWMYRLGLESILGLKHRGRSFAVSPCIPASWDGFLVRWRHGATLYEIAVENPKHRNRGVAEAWLDDARVDAQAIPLLDDGAEHRLRVVMGEPAPESSPVQAARGALSLGKTGPR